MDWEALRERTLGEVGTALATEGVGVAGGLVGASFVGRQVENLLMGKDAAGTQKKVAATDDTTTKFKAWAYNNVPKLGIWYLLRNYAKVEPGEMVTPGKEITVDAKKAFAGSVVFDSLIRLTNHGVPAGPLNFMGVEWLEAGANGTPAVDPQALQADMQRLIQENSALRSEYNKLAERARKYGFMDPESPPAIAEREKKYGFMDKGKQSIAQQVEMKDTIEPNLFGML